jgi:hypothetical protein
VQVYYLISYDLRKPGQNYTELIKQIKIIGSAGWAKPCESAWIIKSDLTPEDIVKRLGALDITDRIVVISVSRPWWTSGLDNDVLKWMRENV